MMAGPSTPIRRSSPYFTFFVIVFAAVFFFRVPAVFAAGFFWAAVFGAWGCFPLVMCLLLFVTRHLGMFRVPYADTGPIPTV